MHQLWDYPCPGYGIYGSTGECISNGVVLAMDVMDIHSKFRHAAVILTIAQKSWPWRKRLVDCIGDINSLLSRKYLKCCNTR